MVKCALVDRCDIFRSAFVFGMALPTFLPFLESPMKAPVGRDILADIFVAIQAESCLRRFVKPLMAGGARLFPFSMPFDHLARHEGCLDTVSPSRAPGKHSECKSEEYEVAGEGDHGNRSDLIHVYGNNVEDRACCQKNDERNV